MCILDEERKRRGRAREENQEKLEERRSRGVACKTEIVKARSSPVGKINWYTVYPSCGVVPEAMGVGSRYSAPLEGSIPNFIFRTPAPALASYWST